MNGLTREVGRVWHEKTKGDLDRTIVDSMFKPLHDASENQTNSNPGGNEIRQPHDGE